MKNYSFIIIIIFWVNQSTSNYLQIEVEPMFDVAHHSLFFFFYFLSKFSLHALFLVIKAWAKDHPSKFQSTNAHFLHILSGETLNRYILLIQPKFEDPATEKRNLARPFEICNSLEASVCVTWSRLSIITCTCLGKLKPIHPVQVNPACRPLILFSNGVHKYKFNILTLQIYTRLVFASHDPAPIHNDNVTWPLL